MLFFHIIVVPTEIVSVCGLKPKPPLLTIVTVIVVGGGVGVGLGLGLGVGVGVDLVGVGVGVVLVGVGVGMALVAVGLGFACVGVTSGCVDVGEGAVPELLAPAVAVSVLADEGAFVVGAALPPQPVSAMRSAIMQMPHKARRRSK